MGAPQRREEGYNSGTRHTYHEDRAGSGELHVSVGGREGVIHVNEIGAKEAVGRWPDARRDARRGARRARFTIASRSDRAFIRHRRAISSGDQRRRISAEFAETHAAMSASFSRISARSGIAACHVDARDQLLRLIGVMVSVIGAPGTRPSAARSTRAIRASRHVDALRGPRRRCPTGKPSPSRSGPDGIKM